MKILRYGDEGPEKPGPLAAGGNIRSHFGIGVQRQKLISA